MAEFYTQNPYDGALIQAFESHREHQVNLILDQAASAYRQWRTTGYGERAALLHALADKLLAQKAHLSTTMTLEMGKLTAEADAEVEKCAAVCRYYAEQGEGMLAAVALEAAPQQAELRYAPTGPVLAIMPWNFPLWQVFRFLAPCLMAGNVALLKHAPNVAASARNIARLFEQVGAPAGLFQNLFIEVDAIPAVIADSRVRGVTLTGSERAGRSVGAFAGAALKPSVLELGGSDPFIVLADADIDAAVAGALTSRFLNAGQTCIAAKRFIVEAPVYDAFADKLTAAIASLKYGDPSAEATTLAPMARPDLRDQLAKQVAAGIAAGAQVRAGGALVEGSFAGFQATLVDGLSADNPLLQEEVFGPVGCLLKATNAKDAIAQANATRFGLGASLWSQDAAGASAWANEIDAGAVFINGFVKSDPRWPFGGAKDSGYGRELWQPGLTAFCNAKLVWQG
ncbi:NAD-dependent succinate-semialdehyde dehydrogenase [Ferrimonas marina]|uniref:Succinate-semialdehyde dehydrogenase / glutarate-semialdehyde dehydrogenase n=1 Tax=Ferrimonas marina TaxID=299255 RepID=A0A1M5MPF2_9GAMM|nr:NAD-dependent succinate-semialdehyde dehydrogenase [Ferrimonas marina]SHG79161.1 succinate-semialdehyde dehydrogenase / glutarate-semialdehyde dehydrogenase [Ferrimonas marina]